MKQPSTGGAGRPVVGPSRTGIARRIRSWSRGYSRWSAASLLLSGVRRPKSISGAMPARLPQRNGERLWLRELLGMLWPWKNGRGWPLGLDFPRAVVVALRPEKGKGGSSSSIERAVGCGRAQAALKYPRGRFWAELADGRSSWTLVVVVVFRRSPDVGTPIQGARGQGRK